MHEYARICVNMPKSASMVFVLRFSISNVVTIEDQGGLGAGAVNLDIPFSILCSSFTITIITKQLIRLFVITQHFLRKFSKRDTITGHCCSEATKTNFAQDTFFLKKKSNGIPSEGINMYNFDLNIFFQKACKFVRDKRLGRVSSCLVLKYKQLTLNCYSHEHTLQSKN